MKKNAFTLIELIFVIVIFAIISMFGADLYTKIYDSYAHTRAVNQLEARTMNAITIISARLEDRIKGTVIARKSDDNTFVDVRSATEDHDIIEWIGHSIESKNLVGNAATPGNSIGWSGYADIDSAEDTTTKLTPVAAGNASLTFTLNTQGSHLTNAGNVIKNLRNNADASFGVIFRNVVAVDLVEDAYGYNAVNDGTARSEYIGNATGANEVITMTYPVRKDSLGDDLARISEQYYIAHSAYAITPTNYSEPYKGPSGAKVADWNFDLQLSYNYAPWNRETYNNDNTEKAIIVRDVSLFRFRNDNGALALKLCLRDAGRNFDPERLDLIVCKSQVVY